MGLGRHLVDKKSHLSPKEWITWFCCASAEKLVNKKIEEIQRNVDLDKNVEGAYLTHLLLSEQMTVTEILGSITELLLAGVDTVSISSAQSSQHDATQMKIRFLCYKIPYPISLGPSLKKNIVFILIHHSSTTDKVTDNGKWFDSLFSHRLRTPSPGPCTIWQRSQRCRNSYTRRWSAFALEIKCQQVMTSLRCHSWRPSSEKRSGERVFIILFCISVSECVHGCVRLCCLVMDCLNLDLWPLKVATRDGWIDGSCLYLFVSKVK